MQKQIKALRVSIDGLAQLCTELKPLTAGIYDWPLLYPQNSKEIDKAVDSLYLAKAWLGKILGILGEQSPYKPRYKTKDDIEPTAEVAKEVTDYPITPEEWEEGIVTKSYIEKVDWLREMIGKIIDQDIPDHEKYIGEIFITIDQIISEKDKNGTLIDGEEELLWKQIPDIKFEMELVYEYLCEARFWLGFELERIKEEK